MRGALHPPEDGRCLCGCGRETKIAPRTSRRRGYVKGKAKPYILGHAANKHYEYREEDRGYTTPCHIWPKTNEDGYGVMVVERRVELAHRVFYERRHGTLPDDVTLHHECKQRPCVREDHLTEMTRGVHSLLHHAERIPATHCKRGHQFDERNTHLTKTGKRLCRACSAWRERQRRKRAHERTATHAT